MLLKNSCDLLPLDPATYRRISVAGPNAKSINSLPGAWTLRWQELGESYMPKHVKSIHQSIRDEFIAGLFDDIAAFVWAGLPGYEGGPAIAELLSGRWNPSGKLPFAYPFGISHIIPYNHKFSEAMQDRRPSRPLVHGGFWSGFELHPLYLFRSHRERFARPGQHARSGAGDRDQ